MWVVSNLSSKEEAVDSGCIELGIGRRNSFLEALT